MSHGFGKRGSGWFWGVNLGVIGAGAATGRRWGMVAAGL